LAWKGHFLLHKREVTLKKKKKKKKKKRKKKRV
jgi:hypothetical protein